MNSFIAWYLFYLWPQPTTNDMQPLTKRDIIPTQRGNKISNPKSQQNYEYLFLIQEFSKFPPIYARVPIGRQHLCSLLGTQTNREHRCGISNRQLRWFGWYPLAEIQISEVFPVNPIIPILFIEITQIISKLSQTSLF